MVRESAKSVDRQRRRRSVLRAIPIALATAIVVVAVVARTCRAPIAPRVEPVPPTPILLDAATGTSSPFQLPLRGPSPPPKADVPVGPARTLHGGPHRTHRAAGRGPHEPKVGFRVAVDGPVAAQVTVSPDESTLYVATLGGQLHALSRADGSRRWSVALGDRIYGTPLVHDDGGVIYVGSDDKKLAAISKTGGTFWKLETEGEVDTSAVFGKDGNVVFASGIHVCSVRRGGDLAWRAGARKKIFTSPAITDDGLAIVGSQDHRVYAIGVRGSVAWKVDLGADVDGAPAISDDGMIHVGTDAGEVVRLDPSGNIVWRTPVLGFVRGTLSVARNGDVLTGTYGPVPRVVRIAPDGAVRGAFAIRGTGAREFGIHGGPLEDDDGVLYFGAQDDAVYAVGPDGVLRWRFETGGDVDAPLTMLSDGSLVIPSEAGTVTLLLP